MYIRDTGHAPRVLLTRGCKAGGFPFRHAGAYEYLLLTDAGQVLRSEILELEAAEATKKQDIISSNIPSAAASKIATVPDDK